MSGHNNTLYRYYRNWSGICMQRFWRFGCKLCNHWLTSMRQNGRPTLNGRQTDVAQSYTSSGPGYFPWRVIPEYTKPSIFSISTLFTCIGGVLSATITFEFAMFIFRPIYFHRIIHFLQCCFNFPCHYLSLLLQGMLVLLQLGWCHIMPCRMFLIEPWSYLVRGSLCLVCPRVLTSGVCLGCVFFWPFFQVIRCLVKCFFYSKLVFNVESSCTYNNNLYITFSCRAYSMLLNLKIKYSPPLNDYQ